MVFKDGDVVEFGTARLSILETPGHTPEGISILVYDLEESDLQPHAVLTLPTAHDVFVASDPTDPISARRTFARRVAERYEQAAVL